MVVKAGIEPKRLISLFTVILLFFAALHLCGFTTTLLPWINRKTFPNHNYQVNPALGMYFQYVIGFIGICFLSQLPKKNSGMHFIKLIFCTVGVFGAIAIQQHFENLATWGRVVFVLYDLCVVLFGVGALSAFFEAMQVLPVVKIKTWLRSNWLLLSACLVVVVVGFALRFYEYTAESIWQDEMRQASYARLKLLNVYTAALAAKQVQPPLDYYLESLFISLLGFTDVGIKMGSLVGGCLGIVAFLGLLLSVFHKRSEIVLFGLVLFAIHPKLVAYSQYARPYATSVLTSLIYLGSLFVLFKSNGRGWRFAPLVFGSTLLFFVSVGLLPLIYVLSCGFVCLVMSCFITSLREKLWTLVLPTLGASIAFLPFYLAMERYTDGWTESRVTTMSEAIVSLVSKLTVPSFKQTAYFFSNSFGVYLWMIGIVVLVLFFNLLKFRSIWSNIGRKDRFHFEGAPFVRLFVAGLTVAFPMIFLVIFYTIVGLQMGLKDRYYLGYVPVFILGLCVLMEKLTTQGVVKEYKRAFLTVLLLSVLPAHVTSLAESYKVEKLGWRDFYQFIKKNERPGDLVYMTAIHGVNTYRPQFVSNAIYYRNGKSHLVRHGFDAILEHYQSEKPPQPENIFIACNRGHHCAHTIDDDTVAEKKSYQRFGYLVLYMLENRLGYRQTIKQFYGDLIDTLVLEEKTAELYLFYAQLERWDGHSSAYEDIIKRVRQQFTNPELKLHRDIQAYADRLENI